MTPEREVFHERLSAALEGRDDDALAAELTSARAADIAETFELLNDEERSRILFALPPHTAAEVIVMLDEAVRGDVVDDLDARSLSKIVSQLPPDDAADVLGELPRAEIAQILDKMPDAQSDMLGELLRYDENSAGGIMTPDVVTVPGSKTVADAVEYVRAATPDEELYEVYVVDADGKLVGAVPLRKLVTKRPDTKLEAICDRDVVTVHVDDDQETVVQIIRKYDVPSAAVVDRDGRLLGRITHDDLLDVAEEEAAEDIYRMAGTDAAEFETSSVFRAARVRLSWLLPCMVGTMVTASILLISEIKFDPALFGALLAFSPMIGAMGGNSGIQISTVIVRGFATGELASTRLARVVWREGRISLAMAPACGLTAWGLASLGLPLLDFLGFHIGHVTHPARLSMSVGFAMTAAILVAGVLAIVLPFLFRRLGVDPAIASGPLITTLNDMVCVSIYMLVAMAIAR